MSESLPETPVDRAGNPLCVLSVHAHPDDEASKGSATMARYSAEGVHTALVCCTGGEAGDILNPAADTPEIRAALASVRMAELAESVRIIGYSSLHLLGYHDSGMPDTDHNGRADNFANAPFDEAVERLVRIIRAERPQVVIGYADDRPFYPHPDHIRVFEITGPAFDAAGDPERFPDSGPAWQPSKRYETGWTRRRFEAINAACDERGIESPFKEWVKRREDAADDAIDIPFRDDRFGTFIDVGDYLGVRRAALLAHRTQVDPDGFWMQLPDDLIRAAFPWEEYALVESRLPGVEPAAEEDDLFAGLR